MDINLRKLGTTQLISKLTAFTADPLVQAHPTLIQAWETLERRRTVDGEAALSLRPEYLDLGDAVVSTLNAPKTLAVELPPAWMDMRRQVDLFTLDYPEVELPLHLEDATVGSFKSENGVLLTLGQLGAGYLSERIRDVPYAVWTKAWRDQQWDKIAELTQTHLGKLGGRKLIAAVVDGQVQGLMASYNAVPHAVVLDLLQDQGLAPHLRHWELTPTHLQVDLKVADVGKNLIAVLRVLNGHSGHFSLRFTAALVSDGYEWEATGALRRGRRRHLSHVNDLLEQLKTAVDDVASVLFDKNLAAIDYNTCLALIGGKITRLNVRQEQVLQYAADAKVENALELISVVAPYGQTKGWGSAVASVLDPLVQYAVEPRAPQAIVAAPQLVAQL